MQKLMGKIVEIKKNVSTGVYIKQRVKRSEQYKYENNPRTPGGRGTYAIRHEYYGTTIDIKIYVYDLNECISFDIRNYILLKNNVQKVSNKLFCYVVEKNKGKKVILWETDIGIDFDKSQLDVICK